MSFKINVCISAHVEAGLFFPNYHLQVVVHSNDVNFSVYVFML